MSKFRIRGVKREHSVLTGLLPLVEQIAALECVVSVIPARISRSRYREGKAMLQVTTETPNGLKLLGKASGGVQEVFVVCNDRDAVRTAITALT